MKSLFTKDYYDQFNVTKWLPTNDELIAEFNARKSKGSKTRFINENLKANLETKQDLINALNGNGMLHGAFHSNWDLIKLNNHINNIENLKTL